MPSTHQLPRLGPAYPAPTTCPAPPARAARLLCPLPPALSRVKKSPPFLCSILPLQPRSSPSSARWVLVASLKPSDLRRLVPVPRRKAVQMDTMTPAAATGAVHAGAGDAADLEKPLVADVAEDPIYRMPDFKMSGKKSDELEPTDAGGEDDGGDNDDEDGDFGEGEEDISEGEEDISEGEGYDNPKGNESKKKQRGDAEENGEEDEEEPEDQEEGGGGDDDDDDDDDNDDDDDDEDGGEDDDDAVEGEDDDQDEDEEEDDDEDSLQPPKKRKK